MLLLADKLFRSLFRYYSSPGGSSFVCRVCVSLSLRHHAVCLTDFVNLCAYVQFIILQRTSKILTVLSGNFSLCGRRWLVSGVFNDDISAAFCKDIDLLLRSLQLTWRPWFIIEVMKPVSGVFYK